MGTNEEAIFEIVKNNFGYDAESSDFIYKQLYDRNLDKSITEAFSSYPDGRIRVKIDNKYKENIDEGWRTFISFFPTFTKEYKVSYEDFVENRVLVNKNTMKLKKAITNYNVDKAFSQMREKNYDFSNKIEYISIIDDVIGKDKVSAIIEIKDGNRNITNVITARVPGSGSSNISFIDISSMSFKKKMSKVDTPKIICFNAFSNGGKARTSGRIVTKYVVTKSENIFSLFTSSGSNLSFSHLFDINNEEVISLLEKSTWVSSYSNALNEIFLVVSSKEGISTFGFDIESEKFVLTTPITKTNLPATDFPLFCKIKETSEFLIGVALNNDKFTVGYISKDGINFEETTRVNKVRNKEMVGNLNGVNAYLYQNTSILLSPDADDKAIKEALFDKVDRDITEKFEIIGAKSLPKNKQLEIVFSINFADWFLCSTSENWTSCLNLDSHSPSSHYQGLPGLLGDPNRMMVYITDGSVKAYDNIRSEKMFSRAWVLLDKDSIFNIIKFYPLELLGPKDLDEIAHDIGFKFKFMGEDFVSKNSITPVYFSYPRNDKLKFSSFIFQDKTTFKQIKDKFHLVWSPSNSYYTIVKDNNTSKSKIKNTSLFHYDGGTRNLIRAGIKITSYFKMLGDIFAVCTVCGIDINETSSRAFSHDDKRYCRHCYEKMFSRCSICGINFLSEEAKEIDGKTICPSCHERFSTSCHICGKNTIKRYTVYEGKETVHLCEGCCNEISCDSHEPKYKKYVDGIRCVECSAIFVDKEAEQYNGEVFKTRDGTKMIKCVPCLHKYQEENHYDDTNSDEDDEYYNDEENGDDNEE